MSVLIKGIEMPTGNDELRLIIHSNGQVIISHKTYYEEAEAIPVPEHGRLIDADALMENAQYKGTYDILTAWDVVAAPTIIPASEEATQREERQDEAPAGPYDLLYEEGGPDA